MPGTTTRTSTQSAIHRAPNEPGAHSHPFGHRSERRYGAVSGDNGETDFYLIRSYAIVERLRRAVADRDDVIGM